MRLPLFSSSWWKWTSLSVVALNRRTGTLTSPKLTDPHQMALDMTEPVPVRRRRSCATVSDPPPGGRSGSCAANDGGGHQSADDAADRRRARSPVFPVVTAPLDSRWRAVYRLQLRPGFTFDDAAAQLDYLAALGVSHVYCSPILEAGSDHGYDVVDHGRVRAALGGREGFERLVAAARGRGVGGVGEHVPHQKGIGGGTGGKRPGGGGPR